MSEKHSEPGMPLDAERLAAADARSKARQEQTKANNALHAKRLREWREAWERLEEASQSAKTSLEVWERLGGVLRDQGYQQHAARVRARLTAWLEATEGNGDRYKCPLTSVTGLRTRDPEGYRPRMEAYAVMATIVAWAAEGDTDRLEALPESYQRRVTPETVERVRLEIEYGSDRPVEAEAIEEEPGEVSQESIGHQEPRKRSRKRRMSKEEVTNRFVEVMRRSDTPRSKRQLAGAIGCSQHHATLKALWDRIPKQHGRTGLVRDSELGDGVELAKLIADELPGPLEELIAEQERDQKADKYPRRSTF